ncbi:hypothetical protein FRC03_008692 [Tulasnella sp. 419]|nr:hypothetical protein FRC03_008692 [Tulasnella sp. 419]
MAVGHDVRLDKVIMVAIWTESVLWGFYSGLFALCLYVLLRKRRGRINLVALVASILLYIIATIHVSFQLSRMINGFINQKGSLDYLTSYTSNMAVTRQFLYAINQAVSDSVVVWRCIVVWQRQWKACVVPVCLLIATTINGLYVSSLYTRVKDEKDYVFASVVHSNQIAFFALSLCTNVVTTSLVASRIIYLANQFKAVGGSTSRYRAVVALVVESGVVYSCLKIVELTLYTLGANTAEILLDSMIQVMGITGTVIFIYVAIGGTLGSTYTEYTLDYGGHTVTTQNPYAAGGSGRYLNPPAPARPKRSRFGGGVRSGADFKFAKPEGIPASASTGSISTTISSHGSVDGDGEYGRRGMDRYGMRAAAVAGRSRRDDRVDIDLESGTKCVRKGVSVEVEVEVGTISVDEDRISSFREKEDSRTMVENSEGERSTMRERTRREGDEDPNV